MVPKIPFPVWLWVKIGHRRYCGTFGRHSGAVAILCSEGWHWALGPSRPWPLLCCLPWLAWGSISTSSAISSHSVPSFNFSKAWARCLGLLWHRAKLLQHVTRVIKVAWKTGLGFRSPGGSQLICALLGFTSSFPSSLLVWLT